MSGLMHRLKDGLRVYVWKFPKSALEEHRITYRKAGITDPEKFLKSIAAASACTGLVLAIATYAIVYLMLEGTISYETSQSLLSSIPATNPVPASLRPFVYALVTYILTPVFFRTYLSLSLKMKISSRKESIDMNIFSLYSALLGFAKARIPLKEAIREVASLRLGEASVEFGRIYYMVEYGNTTLKAAMLEVAGTTPSKKLADLLSGIVGVVEAGGDLARYLEERIQSEEVERKLLYAEYIKKLEMLAEVYLTVSLAIPITIVSIQLAKNIAGQGSMASVYIVIYGFMPLTSLMLVLMLYALSPEKDVERPGMKYLAAIPVFALAGLAVGIYVRSIEFFTLAFTVVGSAISAILLRGKIKEEEMLSGQTAQYINRTLALVEAGKDTTTAFRMAASEIPEPLKRYAVVFAEMVSRGVQRERAFNWLSSATTNPDLKLVSKILSKTVVVSGRVIEVLLSLAGELARINAFRKERDASARTYGLIMVIAALMFLGIAATMSVMLIGQFEKLGEKMSGGERGRGGATVGFTISQVVLDQARAMLRHASYIVSASASVGIAAVRGDFRRIALPFAIMMGITLVASVLFMNLQILPPGVLSRSG